MTYRPSFTMSVFIRVVLLVISTALLTVLLFKGLWLYSIPLMLSVPVLIISLIYFLNSTNRKLSYFFDSVTNDDTTVHYPENIRPDSLGRLHTSLNRLNRHIAEIKIKNEHNEKFFQEMLKSSATGLIAVNEQGYIEQINDAALEFTGLAQISHMDLLKQKNRELYDHMESIKPGQSHTLKILRNSELRLFSLKMAVLNFDSDRYRLFSISDIRTELEENELDSWQKLIRVMTHEIMNSVAPITSLSNTLSKIFIRDNNPLPVSELTEKHVGNIIHGLEVIENTGKGLMRFVEDYRKLTRLPVPEFKPVIITKWLDSILLLMNQRFSEENVRIQIIKDGPPDELLADEKMMNQVMINILNNALDALDNRAVKKIIIHLSMNHAGRLRLAITDNGKGISPEETEKIFIPFYTTRENGSGIGLSLARKIMRLHKGSISVISKPGEQTTFTLNF